MEPSLKWLGKGPLISYLIFLLSSILHDPHFAFNLVSISSLTKTHNCCVTSSRLIVFQDPRIGEKIGGGIEMNDLYILEPRRNELRVLQATAQEADWVLFWHRRLGHALTQSLKIYSFLNIKNSIPCFDCKTCQSAKKHRSVYPSIINKNHVYPFNLIQSNVWCSPLNSVYGHCYFVSFIDAARCT